MDFLKAEIARKRKQIDQSGVVDTDKKFFKRGDLARKQEEEYWKKHGCLVETEQDAEEQNDQNTEGVEEQDDSEQKMLPRAEVVSRLRARDEPIRTFGESDYEAFKRLRRLEILEPEVEKGFRNEMQAAARKLEEDYVNDVVTATEESGRANPNNVKFKDDGEQYDEAVEAVQQMNENDHSQCSDRILQFLRYIQKAWGRALNSRDEDIKSSVKGKLENAQFQQTDDYIQPLYSYLRRKTTPTDILDSLLLILKCLIAKEYIKANDYYMEMAIGNAPWPVGVTNPGIHSRPGRDKIFAKRQVAHVLNDETQRKYIQALKRLMTQCQLLYPGDPSKCVNYLFERM